MKLFSCHQCQQLIFFENVHCTRCNHTLAYLPDRGLMSAMQLRDGPRNATPAQQAPGAIWVAQVPAAQSAQYRLCRNFTDHAVCNWAIATADGQELCQACRLNDIIPNLSENGALDAWRRMETAKRRLLYSLLEHGLPVEPKVDPDGPGLAFSFMADGKKADDKVFTGHSDGLITINIAEADDPFREKMRVQLGETYRTLLGHFRHEIGHYYWDRLVRGTGWQPRFRKLFGDESASYAEAVKRHYDSGPAADWPSRFVSAYASMHPWEDWAETWAHYLHMTDTLDTARAYGLSIRPEPVAAGSKPRVTARRIDLHSFEDLMSGWVPLTIALNSLNRSMGLPDSYPFVISSPALEKLQFVHDVVEQAASAA
jgi:hypothetical protein